MVAVGHVTTRRRPMRKSTATGVALGSRGSRVIWGGNRFASHFFTPFDFCS